MDLDTPFGEAPTERAGPAQAGAGVPQIPDHELLRRIGGGSYGEVWLARNVMGAYRAVKIVYRQTFEHDRPYEREFDGIQKFEPISRSHENLVDVLHVGRNDSAGYFYYVMELADDANAECGVRSAESALKNEVTSIPHSALRTPQSYVPKTLRRELQQRVRIPQSECLEIGLALSSGLAHLHEHGLVHRDVKPSNIIFVNGVPKLADIGLVADVGKTVSFVGTEGYLPPEGPGSPQADLYSLGKVLYEMATGKDRQEFPELPTQLAGSADEDPLLELNAVSLKACHSDPSKRYQSAQDMHAELVLLQSGESLVRLRSLERRLAHATKVGVVAFVLAAVLAAAYFAARLAEQRVTAQLARSHVANGVRIMDEGDLLGSLAWFTEALRLERGKPDREENHRLRIGTVLQQCPKLTQLWFHQGAVNSVQFSADGRWIVTGSDDQTARIWEADTGQAVTPPLLHTQAVNHVAFSPDNRRMVAVCGNTAYVWDVPSATIVGLPLTHSNPINYAEFSPDGKRLVTATGRWIAPLPEDPPEFQAQVWDATTGHAITPPLKHETSVRFATFSPDGQRVVTASRDKTARVWDASTGQPLTPPMRHGGPVAHATFSPDGERIATASYGTGARVWNSATGEPITPPLMHEKYKGFYVDWAFFSPDGRRVLTVGSDKTARVWDAVTGQPAFGPLTHDQGVLYAQFSPDGRRIVTSSYDQMVHFWDAATGRELFPPLKQAGRITHFALSPEGRRVVTASPDGSVRLWDLAADHLNSLILPYDEDVYKVFFSADGQRLFTASAGEGTVRAWNLTEATQSFPPLVQFGWANNAWLSRDGRRLGVRSLTFPKEDRGTQFCEARVYDAAAGIQLTPTLQKEAYGILSRDCSRLITIRGNEAQIWDTATGQPVTPPLRHDAMVLNYALTAAGSRAATVSKDNAVHVWNADNGQRLVAPIKLTSPSGLWFSPDGNRLLVGTRGGRLYILNTDTGELVATLTTHAGTVGSVDFSRDGQRVLTASEDGTAGIWNLSTGRLLAPLIKCRHEYSQASFSPDGGRILSLEEAAARVWDARTGEPVTPLLRDGDRPAACAFSPDGRRVATADWNPLRVRLWELEADYRGVEDLLQLARLLASHQIDVNARFVPVESETLSNRWQTLRAKYPAQFRPAQKAVFAWHRQEARNAVEVRQWSSAAFHWNWLIQAQPTNWNNWFQRGQVHAELDEGSQAALDFAKALELQTDDSDPWRSYALVSLALGKTEDYRDSCRRLLDRFGSTGDGLLAEDIALVCALAPHPGVNSPQLELLAQKATASRPRDARPLYTYGAVLYRAGRLEAAVAKLRESLAIERSSHLSIALPFLAMSCFQSGQPEEARKALDKAQQWATEQAKNNYILFARERPSWRLRVAMQIVTQEAKNLIDPSAPSP